MTGPYVNSFKQRLKRNAPEDNLMLRDAVQGLTEHPGWQIVIDLLDAHAADLEGLMELKVMEHAGYAACVHERKALKAPRDAVTAILDRADHDERELAELAAALENA